ncbi:2'-5' RNA ligase family protein [uncultured Serinicoccus sp.]|uniref:2'-5' RNA ligase family protein n=1 Tax=uncultured Serinicoccus sp. TaxID=735514 RepID=UPI00262F5755|nr:2'-5' RNA ligase family protein [uncultured Serinicoccus sp.]
MSRAHALELVLGPTDDARVRERWAVLEDAGIPSLGRHRGATHRPHLTVASSPQPPDEELLALAGELWSPLLPLRVDVTGLVLLGGRRLTLADLVSPPLAARRAQAELVLRWSGADERPWVPHVSLATRLTTQVAGAALSALSTEAAGQQPGAAGSASMPLTSMPLTSRSLTSRSLTSRSRASLSLEALRWWDPDSETVSAVAGVAA